MEPPVLASRKSQTPRSRLAVLMAFLLGAGICAVRLLLAHRVSFCGTPDACFYLGMAENLALRHRFEAHFLYNYQQNYLALPNSGIEYWRPGISLALLVLRPMGGVSLYGSIVVTSLLGLLFAAAAWRVAMHTGGNRWLALAAFALCLTSAPVWTGSLSPDSGLFYGAAVGWFLALFTVRRQGLVQDVLGLCCIACAYLIRNDAALLLVPLGAVLWARRRSSSESGAAGTSLGYNALMLVGFVLALAPMHLLYGAVLGTAFPRGTARTLFFDQLSDFNRYGDPVSLPAMLAHGLGHMVRLRLTTLASVIYRMAALMIGYPALVFLAALLPARRPPRDASDARAGAAFLPESLGPLSFFATFLFAYGLVLPAIGAFAALRSATALLPWLSVVIAVAVVRSARTRVLASVLLAALVAVNTVAGVMADLRDVAALNQTGATDRAEASALRIAGADPHTALVLTDDPVQFSVTTGFSTAPLPSNGLDALGHAAQDLHATHLVLDTNNPPASIEALEQRLHPVASVPVPGEHAVILVLAATPMGLARRP